MFKICSFWVIFTATLNIFEVIFHKCVSNLIRIFSESWIIPFWRKKLDSKKLTHFNDIAEKISEYEKFNHHPNRVDQQKQFHTKKSLGKFNADVQFCWVGTNI